jgi:hypothetical protein
MHSAEREKKENHAHNCFQDRFAILSALTGEGLKDVLLQVSGGNTLLFRLPVELT